MKSKKMSWEALFRGRMRNGKMLLLSMVMAMILFAGLGTDVRAESDLPLNVEQTCEVSDGYSYTYSISIPEDGVLNISGYNIAGDYVQFSLIDADNNVLLSNSEFHGKKVYLHSYGVKKGDKYYVKIQTYNWLSSLKTTNFTVGFTPTPYWEKESNDSSATATELSAGAKYTGFLTSNSEVDYYKFKLTSNAKVSFTFGPEVVNGESNIWKVDLLNSKGESVQIYYDSTTKTYTDHLKKGTYYFKVSGNYRSSRDNYSLSYTKKNLTVSTPVISSAKAKGKHVKVTPLWSYTSTYENYVVFNKIKIKMKSDCEGYAVKIAAKSNMKSKIFSQNIDVTKKSSLTLEQHFSVRKNYYMQLRGYVTTPFEEKIYGKYSKVKKISLSASDYKKCK